MPFLREVSTLSARQSCGSRQEVLPLVPLASRRTLLSVLPKPLVDDCPAHVFGALLGARPPPSGIVVVPLCLRSHGFIAILSLWRLSG